MLLLVVCVLIAVVGYCFIVRLFVVDVLLPVFVDCCWLLLLSIVVRLLLIVNCPLFMVDYLLSIVFHRPWLCIIHCWLLLVVHCLFLFMVNCRLL